MGEITLLSLLIGSLGVQSIVVGSWVRWHHVAVQRQCEEEEETLTPYETKDAASLTASPFKLDDSPTSPLSSGATTSGTFLVPKDPRLVGWEFKIVRASRDLFRDPIVLQRLCDEESLSGWILLEKLDDRRVRFKRPIALREMINPELVPVDPYRTHYGSARNLSTWIIAIASLTFLLLPAYLGYALVSSTLNKSQPGFSGAPRQAPFAAPASMQPEKGAG